MLVVVRYPDGFALDCVLGHSFSRDGWDLLAPLRRGASGNRAVAMEQGRSFAEDVLPLLARLSTLGFCYVTRLTDGPSVPPARAPTRARFVPRASSPAPAEATHTEEP